ncbi:hypothetical protein [Fructilactobacillus fructivorans]|uniref:YsoA-related TPR repeat protein n=1 Tax=Fructilactobacillus fructivorans TaxID=1614 RepID=A0A0C1M4Y7_9LACO|nr:hypothetical protein [Fructilactobacillus fructivorans]KID41264.1 ysoA-related TPR repeat protein [Fructilactobacillus fructivorans]MCT0152134.1 hypothetical protein [Fructilactobacillus fructivorans]MCT2867783.1 hypothetical protein [Fructilactobacillus fructivorans]MCT2868413.1 hypothetical protein [Fructilactobacillus fructivorans]MCT2873824.1 hypothetical protein [Fructilactobacillus fructivorans]
MNDNQKIRFRRAQNNFKKHAYQKSCQELLALYDEVDDDQVVDLLGHSLFNEKKYVESYRLVEDNFNYLVENDIELVVNIYLKNRKFIPLRIIVDTINVPNKKDVEQEIESLEKINNAQQVESNRANLKHFMHMGGESGITQRDIMEKAEELPYNQYLKGAQFNLVDPDVNPIWRNQLLNNLAKLKFNQPVKFVWMDGKTYTVTPEQLVDELDSPAYQEMQKIINNRYGQEDPIRFQQISQAAEYDAQVLYPFIDKTIQDPEVWVTAIHRHIINPNMVVDNNKLGPVDRWLEKIDKIMNLLLK